MRKGALFVNSYRLTFSVNGKKTEQIVRAYTLGEAKQLIRTQYQGANINFISTGHEKN